MSFRVATDRIQVEEILETHDGEDYPMEEQWPTMEQVRTAQQGVPEEMVTELGLVRKDGYLWDPTGATRFVPPQPQHLRVRLLLVGHAGAAGHRGIQGTQEIMGKRFWWPGMNKDIDKFIHQCLLCVKSRGGGMVPRPLGAQLRASKPKELLHFDFLQMALTADEGDEYLLVLKDGFSTFVMLFPCRAATAAATVEGLLQ